MQIDEQELYDLFKGNFVVEKDIEEQKAEIKASIKDYCEAHELPVKIITAAYNHFKKVASGKLKVDEQDAISEINTMLEKYLSVDTDI